MTVAVSSKTEGKNHHREPIALSLIAIIALLHCALWFNTYGSTPLGASPALDARQNLELAQSIANGTLDPEPFHRAPLYPFILSLFLKIGLPFELLPIASRGLNAIALAITSAASGLLGLRLWKNKIALWISGLAVALNPVLVFFAGDAFDILLATATFATALVFFKKWMSQRDLSSAIMVTILLSIGSALRSHLLPLALIWPIAATLLCRRGRVAHSLVTMIPLMASFLILGLANQKVAEEFRIMPWQGSYNLWAGNHPEASGRIYTQRIRVEFENKYDNPAKLESIALYEKETGQSPPHSIDAMNAHWKGKFFEYVSENPINWLGLMLRKSYFFLNNYEQYDNKTYCFHKQRHAQLRLNPIHWGMLLTLAVIGALVALQSKESRPFVSALIVIFAAYAAGTILFYTPNRFRVPMLPVLAILSSGAFLLPHIWKETRKAFRSLLVICLLITLFITYSGFLNARDTSTWEEDYALLANASLRMGSDKESVEWAEKALELNPTRPDMHEVRLQGHFNLLAFADQPIEPEEKEIASFLESAQIAADTNQALRPILGIYLWKTHNKDAAEKVWQSASETDAFAKAVLIWLGLAKPLSEVELAPYNADRSLPLIKSLSAPESPLSATDQEVRAFFERILGTRSE